MLREPADEDAPALLELGSDPEVTRWFSWGPYRSLGEPRAYIDEQRGRRERGEQLDLLVVDRDAGPIGVTGLSELSARDRRAVVGTWLGRRWWGTGANAASKALILHVAFEVLGLVRVGAYTDVGNARSQRALERLGFRREGVLRRWHRHGEVSKDVAFYGLLAEEWTPAEGVVVQGALPRAFAAPPR
jgi:ribosomal-protein-alanine N-acetyltransferase